MDEQICEGDTCRWGEPEDRPIAQRVARIKVDSEQTWWKASLTIPNIDSTLYVWDGIGGRDYSSYIHEVVLIWSDAECVE